MMYSGKNSISHKVLENVYNNSLVREMVHNTRRCETSLSSPVKVFTDRSKAVLRKPLVSLVSVC